MNTERYYKPIQEDRDWYYVEYYPVRKASKLATLNLTVVLENIDKKRIVQAMEMEAKDWLNRYSIPLFISAWDNKEDQYNFDEFNILKDLIAFYDEDGKIVLSWKSIPNEKIPDMTLDKEYLDNLYSSVEYTTSNEHKILLDKKRRRIKQGWVLIILLPFIFTFIYECVVYFNNFFSLLAFLYIIFKYVQKALLMIGVRLRKKTETETEKEDRLKEQYYYYCKKNPEGFTRLKLEVEEQEAKARTANQAVILKKKS
jgi:hypothetical protein